MYYASIESSIYMRARAPGGGGGGGVDGWGVCKARWLEVHGSMGGGRPRGRDAVVRVEEVGTEGGRWRVEGGRWKVLPIYKRDLVSTDLVHHAEYCNM